MDTKLAGVVQAHPALAWAISLYSTLVGYFAWFLDHSDDVAKVFGLVATVFGCAAGWYTLRIQRRVWQRMNDNNR